MSAATFRRSLKNFVTRRGFPKLIVSDNAKTFQSTAKWLKTVRADGKTNPLLNDMGIKWRFNLSKAPWWGGFFERMVGLVKRVLKKSLGKASLTFQELSELMLDIEFSMNNRPLTYQGEESEMEPLTPNHFIHGRRMKTLHDDANVSEEELITPRRRLRYLLRCKEHYWKRWSSEYLRSLREHHKIGGTANQVQIGEIVLIKADNQPRNMWKLGKVVDDIKGSDCVIREVRLQTVTNGAVKYIERPLQHLYLMELKADCPSPPSDSDEVTNNVQSERRPMRLAARKAQEEIKTHLFAEEEDENQINI